MKNKLTQQIVGIEDLERDIVTPLKRTGRTIKDILEGRMKGGTSVEGTKTMTSLVSERAQKTRITNETF